MLPEKLLCATIRDGLIVPRFLGPHDHPWLQVLIDEVRRYEDRPRRELEQRLREPLPCDCPLDRLRVASQLLLGLVRPRCRSPIPPARVRAAVFGAGARHPGDVEAALREAGATLSLEPQALGPLLFADLPGERRVGPLPDDLDPLELALRANLLLAQGFLFRASQVEIEVTGNAHGVVRQARLAGLLVTVRSNDPARGASLEISGPYALFRRTLVYGRALARILPVLAWCERFRLQAHCRIRGKELLLALTSADPILPGTPPRRFDSKLEARFAREFGKAALDWELVREPAPVAAGGTLIFPDFAIRHRRHPGRHWLLEIAGFWTPDYLTHKLARLRQAGIAHLILAVDAERNCAAGELPRSARVVRFHKRVDPQEILAIIEGAS